MTPTKINERSENQNIFSKRLFPIRFIFFPVFTFLYNKKIEQIRICPIPYYIYYILICAKTSSKDNLDPLNLGHASTPSSSFLAIKWI